MGCPSKITGFTKHHIFYWSAYFWSPGDDRNLKNIVKNTIWKYEIFALKVEKHSVIVCKFTRLKSHP